MKRLRLSVAAVAAVAFMAFTPAALASTLAESNGTVTWTAATGVGNSTSFSDTATTITINTGDDPVTYPGAQPSANCVDADGPGSPGTPASVVTCTGVSTVIANSADAGDTENAGGLQYHPITINGGDGNDSLYGGAGNDTLNGEGGGDTIEGRAGSDTVSGGDGNDNLHGLYSCCGPSADGGDTITGGAGRDYATGGPGDDSIDLGADDDNGASGGPGNDTIRGGDGNDDTLSGGPGPDNLDGGAGNDTLYGDCGGVNSCGAGSDGSDTVAGGAGNDSVLGDGGNDTVDGGAGDDGVYGDYYWSPPGSGNDTLTGGDGDDSLVPGSGADSSDGGAGDDWINESSDDGADTDVGGDGFDGVSYGSDSNANDVVNASLDGQANDGVVAGSGSSTTSDSGNNFGSGIEQLDVYTDNTPVNASGDSAANQINTYSDAGDTVDAGAGTDTVNTYDGADTVNAVDGYPDTINCGPGNDTANVDQFDTTYNCEVVNKSNVQSAFAAPEDAPPSVSWVSPTPKPGGASIASTTPTILEVAAADDKGISKVEFYVGTRLVCTATAAPYRCSYLPQGVDLGRNTLTAIAYDSAGQTATALNQAIVPRFTARSLSAKTTPGKDTKFPFRFTTSGKLSLPANVTPAVACKGGLVSIQFRAGKKTVSNRRVGLKKDCTYKSAVTFRIPARLHPKTVEVRVAFLGNQTVNPRQAKSGRVRVA